MYIDLTLEQAPPDIWLGFGVMAAKNKKQNLRTCKNIWLKGLKKKKDATSRPKIYRKTQENTRTCVWEHFQIQFHQTGEDQLHVKKY